MNEQELRLVLQVALLGEVGPSLRAVAYDLQADRIAVRFYHDGVISDDERESASCVGTELMAALPHSITVSEELIRCDHPQQIPQDLPKVFRRRE
ncbi:hypothetical protein [Longimicrobium terrae]|uniref:Uncharacterized protein n=1 Tax=Longimicrobium terrae TaxID=1639882 RepID=A0A841H2P2_9BACT|nr:hypothetical protein [Longimicrobium terrae]MBB4637985.1 hypothetical protein [Longimicrobium terrae]MBB6072232.1 hypothetical protein [Longimicrobium terrae]NNC28347.1 hypothetical protein [Longimicrobium terrae]